ncbi:MAG: hypothetical protein IT452_18080 [Planctomycetia bacterium]|nr:hypothetical protein [Planctomycetia bacterium]
MDAQLRRVYVASAGMALIATAVSVAWKDPGVTTGVAAGVVVSVVPFATWHAVVSLASDRSARRRALVVAFVLAKYAVLAGAMWVLFRFRLADMPAFGAGLLAGSVAVLGALTVRTR